MSPSDPSRSRGEDAAGEARAFVVLAPGAPDLEVVVDVIERLGLRAELHHDAGSALDRIEKRPPQLIVHGCDLPDMDGATFHRAIERRAGQPIPTLAILPAGRTLEQRFGMGGAGMQAIHHPFESQELTARLGALLPRAGTSPEVRTGPRPTAGNGRSSTAPDTRIRVIGLGGWGTRSAELFAARGLTAHAVDTEAGVGRANLAESHRHRVLVPGRGALDLGVAARALATDEGLGRALTEEADCDLFVVVADLAAGAGALLAALLRRIEERAPGVGRLAVARLPGLRSGPDERALGLVALNAVIEAQGASVYLVQPADDLGIRADAESHAALLGLLDLFSVAGGAGGDPILPITRSALLRFLATPGFIGWRVIELTAEGCAGGAMPWHERLASERGEWQPEGYAWSEAQGVLTLVRAPYGWLDDGGRWQFDRLAEAAWEEAAPCALHPALYIGDPALALLVSTGLPYPTGILALRDNVQADRARLAEKRRAAQTLIPLTEDFFLGTGSVLIGPGLAEIEAPPSRGAEPATSDEPDAEEITWTDEADGVESAPDYASDGGYPALEEAVEDEVEFETETEWSAPANEVAPIPDQPPDETPKPHAANALGHEARLAEPEPAETRVGLDDAPVLDSTPISDEPVAAYEAPVYEPPVSEPPAYEPPMSYQPPAAEAPTATEPPPVTEAPSASEESPAVAPGYDPTPAPVVYDEALTLVRRILASEDLGAEVDLGEIRYVLYDLLEVVREDSTAILREVFRPVSQDTFERHHVNVAVLAILAGDLLKGSLSDVIDLGTAALLHDIGMTETREMWDVDVRLAPKVFDRAVRTHPGAGYRRLQGITGMTGDIARMVLEEHERMDGTGYPEGIVGEAIDPGARILAVCDTLEALTHPRPFREHLTPSEALSRLQILGQYTLDGTIVAALTDALGELLATSSVATSAD